MSELTLPFEATVDGSGGNVFFQIKSSSGAACAISGQSFGSDPYGDDPIGLAGMSDVGFGVNGSSTAGTGVNGSSDSGTGVTGSSNSGWGVNGVSSSNAGVLGYSGTADGVSGSSAGTGNGVSGRSAAGNGVYGETNGGGYIANIPVAGVAGVSHDALSAGASAVNDDTGFGLWASCPAPGGVAGWFQGDAHVTGTLTVDQDIVLTNADCAEEFDVASPVAAEPGTVMVVGDDEALHPSSESYDRRVAGVISGGGEYKPALLLDRRTSSRQRSPVALVGKVCCKVDARHGPINVGDLLTTSPTPGHAMKACDQGRAFGAVIGKALQPLTSGQGLIAILVALQ